MKIIYSSQIKFHLLFSNFALQTERFISKKILTNGVVIKMIVKTIKVSNKGQIAIPQTIREQANIKKGDELVIFESNGKILIEKSQKVSTKMKDYFKDLTKFSEQALKNVWDNKQDEIWNNYLKTKKIKV